MRRRGFDLGSALAAIVIICIVYLLSMLVVAVPFPIFRYGLGAASRRLISVNPFEGISSGVSRFLWENRALDITVQAFVIVVAIICCLALLKPGEVEAS